MASFFDRLIWMKDRMFLDDLVFRLEHFKSDDWDLDSNYFALYKIKPLMDQYARFWTLKPQFSPKNIIEFGIWDGGSTALWFEYFKPQKLVAIDIMPKNDSDYFRRYLKSRGISENIKTYWNIDQTDSKKIIPIIEEEFDEPIDLVIDDASHAYEATKITFEMIFPLLRPGGLYIIEDWAWGHWKDYQSLDHPFLGKMIEPTKLLFELVEATGSSTKFIASLIVFEGFVAIERGNKRFEAFSEFNLEKSISRRPQKSSQNSEEALIVQLHQLTVHADALTKEVNQLKEQLSDRDSRISSISTELMQSNSQKEHLHQKIDDMQGSIIWQMTMKFHEEFVERVLPQGSGRRNWYNLFLRWTRMQMQR